MYGSGLFGILRTPEKLSFNAEQAKVRFYEELNKPEYQTNDKIALKAHSKSLGMMAATLRRLAENEPALKNIADDATSKVDTLRGKLRNGGTRKRKHYRKRKTYRK